MEVGIEVGIEVGRDVGIEVGIVAGIVVGRAVVWIGLGIEEGGGSTIDFPLFVGILLVLFGVYILLILFILIELTS